MNRWQKYVEEGSLLERQENSLYRNVAVVTGGDGTIGAEVCMPKEGVREAAIAHQEGIYFSKYLQKKFKLLMFSRL